MPFPDTHPALTRALQAKGYENPTPVQAAVLKPDLEKKDLLVSAQTGSGKTVAFGLAAAPTLLGDKDRLGAPAAPEVLVIAPTRELAGQVRNELQWLYAETGAVIALCIGGTDARREARMLERGAHIVAGTPGRLCDHLDRKQLDLSKVRVVILDEADEMLDMGFREELEKLLDAAPADRRTLLFSATIAREIAALARKFQKDAERIDVSSGQKQHSDISYRAVVTPPHEMVPSLVNVLRYYNAPTAMVFCNTRQMVGEVQKALQERGFASVAISGEMGQNERTRAIESLRSGLAHVCVATDVAARGIDVPALGLVIHASVPTSVEALLHRSGRTGRAGRKGTCVLMVPFNQRRRAERLLAQARIKAEWEPVPTAAQIYAQDARHLLDSPLLSQPAAQSTAPATEEAVSAPAAPVASEGAAVEHQPADMTAENAPSEQTADHAPAAETETPVPAEGEAAEHHSTETSEPGTVENTLAPTEAPEDIAEPDELVRELTDHYTAAQLANALVRLYRERLPQVEDVRPVAADAQRGAPADYSTMKGAWYRIDVGREGKADPKWLIPLICRIGGIQKRDIGSIRIFPTYSLFQVAEDKVARFDSCRAGADADEPKISPASAPKGGFAPRAGRKPFPPRSPKREPAPRRAPGGLRTGEKSSRRRS
ncbi:DEAD/DEAH box helicase [Oecophyllibacter saccharovorans]|uniref:DEAD/DEAH box helicase n=1 Tax=Oecophyllibacter saccharovorans TaxID=2558360 RepID=UPI00114121EC|nr:DEAD/DEAH box helicase [Oecophyllibacter saccharovorans]QDH15328.1 DEAD/DEAH box helicase [Oecophyllibacter saccharovorans]